MHSLEIIYRDIKPENIMVSDKVQTQIQITVLYLY